MKLLTDKHLFERELGNYMFSVPALLQWASSKGFVLRTNPELAGFDMAQVERVLSAIEAAARPIRDDAMEMVAAIPRLAGHRMAGDPTLSAWLIGADAVRQWREIFTKAIDNGELQIFDAVSLLPVSLSLRSGSPEEAAPVVTMDDGEQIDTWIIRAREIANDIWLRMLNVCQRPTKAGIAPEIAANLWRSRVTTKTGIRISAEYILRHALRKGWKPPEPD